MEDDEGDADDESWSSLEDEHRLWDPFRRSNFSLLAAAAVVVRERERTFASLVVVVVALAAVALVRPTSRQALTWATIFSARVRDRDRDGDGEPLFVYLSRPRMKLLACRFLALRANGLNLLASATTGGQLASLLRASRDQMRRRRRRHTQTIFILYWMDGLLAGWLAGLLTCLPDLLNGRLLDGSCVCV